MNKRSQILFLFLLFFPVAAGCALRYQPGQPQSSNECDPGSQPKELIQSPGGLLVSGAFETMDFNYSEPVVFSISAQNPSTQAISEAITIELNGMHLPNPLVATMAAHETIDEYPFHLDVQPGESFCRKFAVGLDTYENIGTGNYNLYFVEAADHLDHMNLSGALAIQIMAPRRIAIDQDLQYQVEIHNPTSNTVFAISVQELHLHFEEFIPALLPGETVTFSYTLPSSQYQNSNVTGVTVMTGTLEFGSDLASTIIEVEGYFDP